MRLNVNSINAKAPYQTTPIPGTGFVSFITDFNVQYAVGFDKDDTTMPFTQAYQFSIINVNNKKSPRDHKVRETIIAIIENFFADNQEVMLYICETGDGKQSMRSRLFGYWVNHYKQGWNIVFLSATVKDEDGILNYAAIIARQDHPHLQEIIREFGDTVTALNAKPQ